MNDAKTSRPKVSTTESAESKKNLETYQSEGRKNCDRGQETFCPSSEAPWYMESVSMDSPITIASLKSYLENDWKETRRETELARRSEKFRNNLGQPFRSSSWKELCKVGLPNRLFQGLRGGGSSNSKREAKHQEYEPLIIYDEVYGCIQRIENESENGRYDIIFGSLDRISDWEDTYRFSDAAIKYIRFLCRPTTQALPYLLRERIIEKLPTLLFLILRNPNFKIENKIKIELLEGFKNLQIIDGKVGSLEIAYYKELCLLLINKLPPTENWKGFTETIRELINIAKAIFNPFSASIETVESLCSICKKVYGIFAKMKEESLLKEYIRIQSLKLDILNKNEESMNEMIETAMYRDSDSFVKRTCLMCVKQLMITIKEGYQVGYLDDFLFELFNDRDLQNMCIKVCLEVDSRYKKAHKWVEEEKTLLPKNSDELKMMLLRNSERIKEDLKQTNINWKAYKGISPINYKNSLNVYRNACEETKMIYVDIKVSEFNEPNAESFPILSKVTEFLNNSTLRVLLLLGNAGTGKSLFCYRLGKHLLESHSNFFPLYCYLPVIEHRKNQLAEYCLDACNLRPLSEDFVNREILFILDGYNEINEQVNLIISNNFFRKFPNCKVLFTCRTHEENSIDNFVRHIGHIPIIKERKILYVN